MAKQTPDSTTNDLDHEGGDPLFTLKHAEAEADLSQQPSDFDPATDEFLTSDTDDELDEGPRDRQGQRRGEGGFNEEGSAAGSH
ncbi:hypothetical protein [uncultured Hymenobacter sp.]|uniref:hypothetical protein n=1 Tax=uncultured Hymenobacter sp. TaxID=170016 RepID=UPI0035CB00C1